MMKVTLRFSSVLFALLVYATAWAQPANDHCSGAIPLTIYANEEEAVPVEGDTRNTTDGALDNIPVCSANFYRDDVWYSFTTPADAPEGGYVVKYYFGENGTDVNGIGGALYSSCDADPGNVALICGNDPANNWTVACVGPNETIYVRVWSTEGDAAAWQTGWGTFRIAVFPRPFAGDDNVSNVLWGDEPGQGDFAGGLNNWTTEGMQCNGTPPENALWTWDADGFPFYTFGSDPTYEPIAPINSKTLCNGAAIFDSGFLDLGTSGVSGSGACPWDDHEGSLTSPIIDISGFDVAGVSLVFNQSMQRFAGGQHFVEYSTDGGTTWTTIEINTDKTYLSVNPDTGEGYYNEEFRLRLADAEGSDQLRIRFRFLGGAYWWVIDDVRIVETECNNTRLGGRIGGPIFYAVAPWALVPTDQVHPYPVLADVYNAGACVATNVVLNHTVVSESGNVIYDEDLSYGDMIPDTLVENRNFPELVSVPSVPAMYDGIYTLSQDSVDFDPTDNIHQYGFTVGGYELALEDGATRAITPAASNFDKGVPMSYAYGNYFWAVNDAEVSSIRWGASNASEMTGVTVNVFLFQWTDTNGDEVSSSNERRYVGIGAHTFTGTEGDPVILDTELENFDNPGEPVTIQGGFGYIAIIEYQGTDPNLSFFMEASEARNYDAVNLAFDQAFDAGEVDHRFYASVLGLSMDGNVAEIDYGVTTGTGATTFGWDVVPVVRLVLNVNSTDEDLAHDNLVSVYPNPVIDQLQVKLDFVKSYSDVQLRLINHLGQTVLDRTIKSTITNHIESLNVRDLSAGSYMLQVETEDGQRSIPVVIVK